MKRTIKLLSLLSVIAIIFTFAACNKNDSDDDNDSEDSVQQEAALEGKWQSEEMKEYVYTFNADGTGKYAMPGKTLDLTYKTEEDTITITFLEEGFTPVTLRYVLDGDRLNIKDSFGKDTFYLRVND